MKIPLSNKSRLSYIIPIVVAITARIILYIQWLESPFRYYHTVHGLDMQTFIRWGELFYNGKTSFSMYKLFIAAIYALCGKAYLTEGIVAAQMLMGVITTAFTVYLFRHIFRNRTGALIAGIAVALYTPLMVYETQVLKETLYLTLSLLALYAFLMARRHHFNPLTTYIAGCTAILPFFIRFSGILLLGSLYLWLITYCYRKKTVLKPTLYAVCGSLTIAVLIFAYEGFHGRSITHYFTPNTPYILGVGATNNAKSMTFSVKEKATVKVAPQPLSTYIATYTSKLASIFSGYEQPNNINYYFVRRKLPILQLMIGSFVIIPIAVAGMIMLIISFRKEKKAAILFLYTLSFVIPMVIFLPLARYKIALTPMFAIFAAWWITLMLKLLKAPKKQPRVIPLMMFLCAFLFSGYICRTRPERRSDAQAYGLAASYIPIQMMEKGNFSGAEKYLIKYYATDPDNPYIMLNYVSSLMGTGQPRKAEKILLHQQRIDNSALLGRYFYELGECSFILRNYRQALKCYESSLHFPISEQREKLSKSRIAIISRILRKSK